MSCIKVKKVFVKFEKRLLEEHEANKTVPLKNLENKTVLDVTDKGVS